MKLRSKLNLNLWRFPTVSCVLRLVSQWRKLEAIDYIYIKVDITYKLKSYKITENNIFILECTRVKRQSSHDTGGAAF